MHSLWDVLDDDAQELVRRHAAAKSLAELLRTTVNTRKGEFEWIERRLSPRLRGRWLVSRTTPNPTSRDSCTLHLDLSVPVGLGYLSTVMGPSNLWKVTRDFSRAAGLEFTPRADEIFGSTSMAHSVYACTEIEPPYPCSRTSLHQSPLVHSANAPRSIVRTAFGSNGSLTIRTRARR